MSLDANLRAMSYCGAGGYAHFKQEQASQPRVFDSACARCTKNLEFAIAVAALVAREQAASYRDDGLSKAMEADPAASSERDTCFAALGDAQAELGKLKREHRDLLAAWREQDQALQDIFGACGVDTNIGSPADVARIAIACINGTMPSEDEPTPPTEATSDDQSYHSGTNEVPPLPSEDQ